VIDDLFCRVTFSGHLLPPSVATQTPLSLIKRLDPVKGGRSRAAMWADWDVSCWLRADVQLEPGFVRFEG
jgi:hypothetical protein